MDFLDSIEASGRSRKHKRSRRVQSWYFYEQYKKLEQNQLDKATQLKLKVCQDKLLHQEFTESNRLPKYCSISRESLLGRSRSHVPGGRSAATSVVSEYYHDTRRRPYTQTSFRSQKFYPFPRNSSQFSLVLPEECKPFETFLDDCSESHERQRIKAHDNMRYQTFSNTDTLEGDAARDVNVNEDCRGYMPNMADVLEERLKSVKQEIAGIKSKLSTEIEESQYMMKSKNMEDMSLDDDFYESASLKQQRSYGVSRLPSLEFIRSSKNSRQPSPELRHLSNDLRCPSQDLRPLSPDLRRSTTPRCPSRESTGGESVPSEEPDVASVYSDQQHTVSDGNLWGYWTKLVSFAYRVIQLNHGNCYYDYSSQFMTAVLACDMLCRSVNRMCKCRYLQPFVVPLEIDNTLPPAIPEEKNKTATCSVSKKYKKRKANKADKISTRTYVKSNKIPRRNINYRKKYNSEGDCWQGPTERVPIESGCSQITSIDKFTDAFWLDDEADKISMHTYVKNNKIPRRKINYRKKYNSEGDCHWQGPTKRMPIESECSQITSIDKFTDAFWLDDVIRNSSDVLVAPPSSGHIENPMLKLSKYFDSLMTINDECNEKTRNLKLE